MKERLLALLGRDSNSRTRNLQIVVIGVTVIGLISIVVIFKRGDPWSTVTDEDSISITSIDGVEAEDRWLQQAAGRVNTLEEAIAAATRSTQKVLDETEEIRKASERLNRNWAEQLGRYEDRFEQMERRVQNLIETLPQATVITPSETDARPSGPVDPFGTVPVPSQQGIAAPGETVPVGQSFQPSLIRFELSPRNAVPDADTINISQRDPSVWLAAGSFAPGVIVTGADAPAGVSSQSDPRPVTLRITGKAVTAASRSGAVLRTEITGCTVTGEARGDLSSERVYIRLLRMTCRHDDAVIETDVKGFVAGAGQAGVRGVVVSREGDLVGRSFVAGALSGFGTTASSALAPPTIATSEAASNVLLSDQEALARAGKAGLAGGIGTAGEKLADYYIERAEQYQPVVSLKGGTEVEVVFIEGTWIDGRQE